jgi:radical SAM-linked protein
LPIGMESESENMYVQLENGISMEAVKDRLNKQLPDGLVINDCWLVDERPKQAASKAVTYDITLSQGFFDDRRLRDFEKSADMMIVRSNTKGVPKTINLKEAVIEVERLNGKNLRLKIVQEPGKTVRPAEFLQHVFELEVKELKTAKVVKVRN